MKITWLGHSAFRLEFGSSVVLIDPFLSGSPAFKGDAEAASAGATHVLITHGHDDHLGDSAAIAQRTGAQVVANFEICMFLMEQGAKNINPGNTGGTVQCGDFSVSFTQALHSSGVVRDGKSVYLGNPNGLVVTPKSGPVVYHMGDTGIFSDMALIDELYRPKVGIVPVGDRFTMDGRTAALAVNRYFHFDVAIPCHFATFGMLAPDASSFVTAMAGSKTRAATPAQGEAFEV